MKSTARGRAKPFWFAALSVSRLGVRNPNPLLSLILTGAASPSTGGRMARRTTGTRARRADPRTRCKSGFPEAPPPPPPRSSQRKRKRPRYHRRSASDPAPAQRRLGDSARHEQRTGDRSIDSSHRNGSREKERSLSSERRCFCPSTLKVLLALKRSTERTIGPGGRPWARLPVPAQAHGLMGAELDMDATTFPTRWFSSYSLHASLAPALARLCKQLTYRVVGVPQQQSTITADAAYARMIQQRTENKKARRAKITNFTRPIICQAGGRQFARVEDRGSRRYRRHCGCLLNQNRRSVFPPRGLHTFVRQPLPPSLTRTWPALERRTLDTFRRSEWAKFSPSPFSIPRNER